VAVKVRRGKGGDAVSVVVDAINTPGSFDRRIVVLDNDKPKSEMEKARREARIKNVELIENNPCLEAFLLSILNNGREIILCDIL
jgi:hypothetical protein